MIVPDRVPENLRARPTLSVTLEVEPGSSDRLSSLIETLKAQEESPPHGVPEKYDRLKTAVPVLHFMSISVFPGWHYDPALVFEANFDGPPGVFWGQLEAALGEQLRDMLRCCKRPRDEVGPLYDALTAAGSRTQAMRSSACRRSSRNTRPVRKSCGRATRSCRAHSRRPSSGLARTSAGRTR